MRVLVTGANGFVGHWLIRRLAQERSRQIEVTACGQQAADDDPAALDLDITDAGAVDAVVERVRPERIVHLAAVSHLGEARANARRTWDVNLIGTLNLAEAVMRHVPDARFLNVGSSEVYGGTFNALDGTVDESAALAPRNVYAATKAAADLMIGQMAEDGLRAVRFRPFNHTGPGQSGRFVVPGFASQIAAAECGLQPPVIRVGNLDARRDFLDVRDVVDAYVAALLAPELPHDLVFNLASGTPRRIGDILDALLGLTSANITVETDPSRLRPSDTPIATGRADRATAALGWSPKIPWERTLADVLGWEREQAKRRG